MAFSRRSIPVPEPPMPAPRRSRRLPERSNTLLQAPTILSGQSSAFPGRSTGLRMQRPAGLSSRMKPAYALLALALAATAAEVKPVFTEDFEKAEVGKVPEGFLVIAGGFAVQKEEANRFLELPGSPLDTFGVVFGPNEKPGLSASAKIFGTKVGRKFPAFGVSVQGVGGYRLQVSAGKKALELFKGDEAVKAVPFEWQSGAWTTLRVQVRAAGGKWIVEGKAWPSTEAEPKTWTISLETNEAPPQGRPALWGSPFSGEAIRFDDLVVAPAH